MKTQSIFLTLGLLTILSISSAAANGLGGQRLEKNVGKYTVDIGTDQMSQPLAGTPILFDFNLFENPKGNLIKYTDVDVYIADSNNNVLVEADIAPANIGPTILTFTFPAGGTYELGTTFYDATGNLAEAKFPLTIGGAAATGTNVGLNKSYAVYGIFIGIVIGGGLTLLLMGGKRRK